MIITIGNSYSISHIGHQFQHLIVAWRSELQNKQRSLLSAAFQRPCGQTKKKKMTKRKAGEVKTGEDEKKLPPMRVFVLHHQGTGRYRCVKCCLWGNERTGSPDSWLLLVTTTITLFGDPSSNDESWSIGDNGGNDTNDAHGTPILTKALIKHNDANGENQGRFAIVYSITQLPQQGSI